MHFCIVGEIGKGTFIKCGGKEIEMKEKIIILAYIFFLILNILYIIISLKNINTLSSTQVSALIDKFWTVIEGLATMIAIGIVVVKYIKKNDNE